jgi:DNA polymerase III delta prime subunit
MERTTLAVPVKFREMLNENYDGENDLERLKLWANEYEVSEEHGDVPDQMMIKVENMIEKEA